MALALDGVRILDLSRLLPGAYCSLILADLGADVVKVEDTGMGDYLRHAPPPAGNSSAMFQALNRNKRSIALDLKHPAGRGIFLSLVERHDVVLESFRPGVMARLGLAFTALSRRNPAVILCSLTGYGQDGPYRDRAGHDINYVAAAGMLSLTDDGDGTPVIPAVQVGDLAGGGMSAAIAILAALHERARSGEGQHCDVAILDGVLSWLSIPASRYFAEGTPPQPRGDVLSGRHPCYRLYACAGGHLSVGAIEPKFWQALMDALGLGHLGDAGFADGAEAAAVVAEIEAVLRQRTAAEWMTLLGDRDVCVEPVVDIQAALDHPQARHRQMTIAVGEGGSLPQVGFPFRLNRTPPTVRRPAPGHGEHTAEVLAEIGYGAAAYADLRQEGVIR